MLRVLLPAAVLLAAAVPPGPAAPPAPAPVPVFPIGFWCGPPDKSVTPAAFRLIADAGFTHVMPPCGGSTRDGNRRTLDAAKAAGLTAYLADGRIPLAVTGQPGAKAALDAVVADYAGHPALAGYVLADEPGPGAFPGLGEVAAYLRAKDPAHPAYVNVLPNHAPPAAVGPDYEGYLDGFVKAVRPFALSYDHYHFTKGGDGPLFLENLDVARRVGRRHRVPFWQVVLLTPHGPYRRPTEAEKRYEAMQTLAYGGRGLMWFTYWPPDDPAYEWGAAVVDRAGKPTDQYAEVRRVNAAVRVIGRYLLGAESVAVLKQGREPGVPARLPGPGVTVGVFAAGPTRYALVASRDYTAAAEAAVVLDAGGRPVARLDQATEKWVDAAAVKVGGAEVEVRPRLAPGAAELYRW